MKKMKSILVEMKKRKKSRKAVFGIEDFNSNQQGHLACLYVGNETFI